MSQGTKSTAYQIVQQACEQLAERYSLDSDDTAESIVGAVPRPRQIIQALKMLIELLIPVRDERDLCDQASVNEWLETKLNDIWALLLPEIERAVPYRWLGRAALVEGAPEPQNAADAARHVMQQLFGLLPEIRESCVEDLRAAYAGDPAALTYLEIKLCYPGVLAIVSHRIAHALYTLQVPIVPRIMSEWTHTKTGVDIHPGARIGRAFFIDHATGVVIGETAKIGDNVKLYQGVTLGARSFALDDEGNPVKHVQRHPTIEDSVIIYSHATILGGDTVVGKGSIIGGNVFITSSVPPGSLVLREKLGQQMRSLLKSEDDWMI